MICRRAAATALLASTLLTPSVVAYADTLPAAPSSSPAATATPSSVPSPGRTSRTHPAPRKVERTHDPSITLTSPAPTNSSAASKADADAKRRLSEFRQMVAQTLRLVEKDRQLAELAEQDYNYQLSLYKKASTDLASASNEAEVTGAALDHARTSFAQLMQEQYMSGSLTPTLSAFLVSGSPGELLDTVTYGNLVADQGARVVSRYEAASRRHSAALGDVRRHRDARARALEESRKDVARSNERLASASRLVSQLRKALSSAKDDAVLAQSALQAYTGINGGLTLAQEQEISRRFMARQDKIKSSVKTAPSPGHWTPSLGRTAARRALSWAGLPYSWAGGNSQGPTNGVCSSGYGGGGENDCKVWGFDCSGLVMYAWGPYLNLAHFAATQYTQAGKLHPEVKDLLPGDLVFWSVDGRVSGIHHVAIYVGGGLVVQAPQSGSVVQTTPLAAVSSGYLGATRPMTDA